MQQMAVTFVTHEVEAAREAERRQIGQEAAKAESARDREECAARKSTELARKD